jgi:hypothetical protein
MKGFQKYLKSVIEKQDITRVRLTTAECVGRAVLKLATRGVAGYNQNGTEGP